MMEGSYAPPPIFSNLIPPFENLYTASNVRIESNLEAKYVEEKRADEEG